MTQGASVDRPARRPRRGRLLVFAAAALAALAVSSPWWTAAWARADHFRALAAAESRFGPLTAERFAPTASHTDPLWRQGEAGLLARLDAPDAPRPALGHVAVDPATGNLDVDPQTMETVLRLRKSLAAAAENDLAAGRHGEAAAAVRRLGTLAGWVETEPTLYAHLVGLAVERDQHRLLADLAADPHLAPRLQRTLVDNDLGERLRTAIAFELVATEAFATPDYARHRLADPGDDGAVEASFDRLLTPWAEALSLRSRSENLRTWCALADAFPAAGDGWPAADDPALADERSERSLLQLTPNLRLAVERYREADERRREIAAALAPADAS